MAQRTVALYEGKYIGIETIYTVINGQQINIPEKLKDLRTKSQKNELFCPCGCGTNLILVAGDRNLREQHFREKIGTGKYKCSMPTEGKTSVDSRIVLKCWLDDKIKTNDIESRVPIDVVEDTKRKPEFTFLSRENKFAIRYWRSRNNILDDRLDVLEKSEIKTVYIVDGSNGGIKGQYPEALMKIQDRQKFCLLLSVKEAEYDKAFLKAVFYTKDLDGYWQEIVFSEGNLKDYAIEHNEIVYANNTMDQLLSEAKTDFESKQQIEKERRNEEERLRIENNKKIQLDLDFRQQEENRLRQEKKRIIWQQWEESKNYLKHSEEERIKENERLQEEKLQREKDFRRNMESNFTQQETQVRDAEGNRWFKCKFCGKIGMEKDFPSYGGPGEINLGTCYDCNRNNPLAHQEIKEIHAKIRGNYDPNICPECGGRLQKKKGPFGYFIGCSNYPKCNHSRKINH